MTSTQRLVQALSSSTILNDSNKVIEIISSIPEMLSCKNIEMEPLISPMTKLLASHNATIKQISCEFLVRASEKHPEVGVLVSNILTQDVRDPNPQIRGLALSALCSMPGLESDQCLSCIRKGLEDQNPSVRKAAVTGTGKYFQNNPDIVRDSGLIDVLYAMVKDSDPVVVTFALQTLNVILKDEGGVVITRSMAHYLLGRIPKFQELEFCFVMDYLQQYYDLKKDDCAAFMTALDPFLDSKSGPMVLSSAKVYASAMLKLGNEEKVRSDFYRRLQPQLGRFLHKSISQDFQCSLLDFILELNVSSDSSTSIDIYKECRLRYKDTLDLSLRKIRVLSQLFMGNQHLSAEIGSYLLNQFECYPDEDIKKELLSALLNGRFPKLIPKLRDLFRVDLITFGKPVLSQVRKLVNSYQADAVLFGNILSEVIKIPLSSSDEIANVLWVLTRFSRHIPTSPTVIENIYEKNLSAIVSFELQKSFLFASISVFVLYPANTQYILGKIFEFCSKQDVDLKNRVSFYSKCLQNQDIVDKLASYNCLSAE